MNILKKIFKANFLKIDENKKSSYDEQKFNKKKHEICSDDILLEIAKKQEEQYEDFETKEKKETLVIIDEQNSNVSKEKICSKDILLEIDEKQEKQYEDFETKEKKETLVIIDEQNSNVNKDEICSNDILLEIDEKQEEQYEDFETKEKEETLAIIDEQKINCSSTTIETEENLTNMIKIKEIVKEDNNNITVDMLKTAFSKIEKNQQIKKFNVNAICRFLEEIFQKTVVSKIDEKNYDDFVETFIKYLDLLKPKAKKIIIEKYGLYDGIVKTASEVSRSFEISTNGVSTSIYNSIKILKESQKIERFKKYLLIQEINDEIKDKEDISFIMSLLD